jgi:predicted TIM-barrel fold metal-dependent hydrolase
MVKTIDCMQRVHTPSLQGGVVDFHVHVTPPEITANIQKYAEKDAYFALLSTNPHAKFASAEDVIGILAESRFDRAVIFGFAFRDPGLCRMVNDYVIEKTQQFPEKLTGFISVSPNEPGMENEINRCYDAGLRGIGELYPDGQGFNVDDKQETCALIGTCLELDIPMILHANEPVGHHYVGKNDIPLNKIERFIENAQGVRIVLAHWGGGLLFFEAMPELREKFRNVYYDTAASPFLYSEAIYQAALALGLGEKILFGSDFPLLPPSRYLSQMEALSPLERDRILGGNAEQLLSKSSHGGTKERRIKDEVLFANHASSIIFFCSKSKKSARRPQTTLISLCLCVFVRILLKKIIRDDSGSCGRGRFVSKAASPQSSVQLPVRSGQQRSIHP